MPDGSWNRIASAVGAALSVPPAEWSNVLSQALHGDSEAVRKAREYLDAADAGEDFLEAPAECLLGMVDQRSTELTPGVRLAGRFELVAPLGSGAMGHVFEAFDHEVQDHLALKVIRPEFCLNPDLMNRFRRELKYSRKISHRNVCSMRDLFNGTWRDGTPLLFVTMELLKGETLEEKLAGGAAIDEGAARTIAGQVITGLEAVHRAGIIHGDIKLSNIMYAVRDGGETEAVLADFGLARRIGPAPDQTLAVRDEGVIAGTPSYMPPEQIRGEPIDERADIHAVGVVLFRLVSGRMPFEGDGVRDVIAKRLHGKAPRVRALVPEISRSWDDTVAACLSGDREQRPLSVAVLRAMLAGLAPTRRSWLTVALPFKVALASLIPETARLTTEVADPEIERSLALGEDFLARRGRYEFEQAVTEFRGVLRKRSECGRAWVGLAEALAGLSNWGWLSARDGLTPARESARRALLLNPDNPRGLGVMGYINSTDVKTWLAADPWFEKALRLQPRDPKLHFWYATHLGRTGRHGEAIAHLKIALDASPQFLFLNHQLATEYYRAGRNEEFLAQARELVRVQPQQERSRITLAWALMATGRYQEAEESLREAAVLKADIASLLAPRAILEGLRGRRPESRLAAAQLERLAAQHPQDPLTLAAVRTADGRPEDAVAGLNRALDDGSSSVLSAWFHPLLKALRPRPDFQAFVARMGLRITGDKPPG